MSKAGVERGFAENVKVDVCCTDFLRASDAIFEQLGFHERAARGRRRIVCCKSVVGIIRVACSSSAGAKATMQIANVRDFDVDAVHESPLISIIASWYSLSLPAFLIFLKIFLGMLGSRYSQKL